MNRNQLKHGFVCGMPRSRTAWLAAWLTTETSLCFHDTAVNTIPPVIEARVDTVLISGPEVCVDFGDYSASYPDAPWLVVQRADSFESFKRVLTKFAPWGDDFLQVWWAERQKMLDAVIAGPRTLTVDFEDLDHPNMARTIWDHLLPGKEWNSQRWAILNNLNIQQELFEIKADAWLRT